MKPLRRFLGSNNDRQNVLQEISALDIAETYYCVIITDAMSKSTRQRGLQWKWYGEVANSGIGAADTKEGVHRFSKWQFARPILMRDDPIFAVVLPGLRKEYKGNKAVMRHICDTYVSTEGEGFAISEYLSDFERYYRQNGVALTIPEKGLLRA